jgi:RNA polymerase sigma factor (sigma-70 family)
MDIANRNRLIKKVLTQAFGAGKVTVPKQQVANDRNQFHILLEDLDLRGDIGRDGLDGDRIETGGDLERFRLVDDQPDPESCAVYRDELRSLHALIESMPTQMRRVFTLRKVYGLSQNDIAVQLGLTVSTVEKHVVRGLRFCSERMDRSSSRTNRMAPTLQWNIAADRSEN